MTFTRVTPSHFHNLTAMVLFFPFTLFAGLLALSGEWFKKWLRDKPGLNNLETGWLCLVRRKRTSCSSSIRFTTTSGFTSSKGLPLKHLLGLHPYSLRSEAYGMTNSTVHELFHGCGLEHNRLKSALLECCPHHSMHAAFPFYDGDNCHYNKQRNSL